jgi:hypothetical protein
MASCKWCGVERDAPAVGPHACEPSRVRRRALEDALRCIGGNPHNTHEAIVSLMRRDPIEVLEAPEVVMWGGRKMREGRCPPGDTCLACDRLGKHLEPAE